MAAFPQLQSVTRYIGEQFITLHFQINLDASNPPLSGAFSYDSGSLVTGSAVGINGSPRSISAIEVNSTDKTVKVTFIGAFLVAGDIIDFIYTDPTANDDPLAIQDSGLGIDAQSFSQSSLAVSETRPAPADPTPPVFVSAATNTDGTKVILTYDEALIAPNALGMSFSVNVGSSGNNVTAVTIVGSTVELTLSIPVENGQFVTVGYSDPTTDNDINAVQDAAGNDATTPTLGTAVTNNVPAADTTAPVFVSAATSTDGTKVILTYDSALYVALTAPNLAFAINVGGSENLVTNVTINGSTVELTLTTAITNGQAVTVAYTDLSPMNELSAVQDLAGNDAASLVATSVTNNVAAPSDTTAPAFQSAATSTDGTKIILTYDEALDASTAEGGTFLLQVAGLSRTVTSVTVSGLTVELSFSPAIENGQTVAVQYTKPLTGNVIQDTAGNDASDIIPSATVTNNVAAPADTTAPVFQSAATSTDGTKVILTYDEALDASTAAGGTFLLEVAGLQRTVTAVTVNGLTVELSFSPAIENGQTVAVQYTKPLTGGVIQDAAGNDASDIIPSATVTNNVAAPADTTAPIFQSAATSTDGTKVILTYDSALSEDTALSTDFVVTVAGINRNITGVTINGSTVELTLGSPVTSGQTVAVSYIDRTTENDPYVVQDLAGNDADSISPAESVTNSVPSALSVDLNGTEAGSDRSINFDAAADAMKFTAASTTNVSGGTLVPNMPMPEAFGALEISFTLADFTDGVNETLSLAGSSVAFLNNLGAVTAMSTTQLTAGYFIFDVSITVAAGVATIKFVSQATTGVNAPMAEQLLDTLVYSNSATTPTTGNRVFTVKLFNDQNTASDSANFTVVMPTVDTTAPVFVSAATSSDGTKVIMTYDGALDADNAAGAGTFTVMVGGVARTVSSVTVTGSTVELTLASPITNGQSVTVAYTDPNDGNDPNAVQDAAGNDAATLPATSVTNSVPDTTAPVFQSAATSTDGNKVILTYDSPLAAATAAASAFAVSVDGSGNTVTTATINGSTVELTLSTAITNGQTVTVAYTDPVGNDESAIQDAAGNDASSISPAASVTNSVPAVDTTAPVFQSAATNASGTKVILTYDGALDAAHAAGTGAFTVMVGGVARTVSAVTVTGSTVELTLASAITNGQTVTIAYGDPTTENDPSAVQDAAGNDAISILPAVSVTNSVPAPSPEPDPTPPLPDNDDVPDEVEDEVPGLSPPGGGAPVAGDGNGDGTPDSQQSGVTSVPFLETSTAQTNPQDAPPIYVSLVADSDEGKSDTTDTNSATLSNVRQLDAPPNLPPEVQMPLGLISFESEVGSSGIPGVGVTETFSLYIDTSANPDLVINAYFKQDASGNWVNLASPEFGGQVVTEGGRTRLDFVLTDGGPFDSDGVINGSISDPGAPGYQSGVSPAPADTDNDQFPDALEAANGLSVGVKDNDVFTSTKFFAMQLYRDILYREADDGGLAYWISRLDAGKAGDANGLTYEQVAEAFLASPEFQQGAGAIARLYFGLFERMPDAGGMNYWVDQMESGTTLQQIAAGFTSSAEFAAKYPNPSQHIQSIYQSALQRPPTGTELAQWTAAFATGKTAADLAISLTTSDAFIEQSHDRVSVSLDYLGLLGRPSEPGGFEYWLARQTSDLPELQVIDGFLNSTEYHDRFLPSLGQATIASLVGVSDVQDAGLA